MLSLLRRLFRTKLKATDTASSASTCVGPQSFSEKENLCVNYKNKGDSHLDTGDWVGDCYVLFTGYRH
jgi:hypothetical protein